MVLFWVLDFWIESKGLVKYFFYKYFLELSLYKDSLLKIFKY